MPVYMVKNCFKDKIIICAKNEEGLLEHINKHYSTHPPHSNEFSYSEIEGDWSLLFREEMHKGGIAEIKLCGPHNLNFWPEHDKKNKKRIKKMSALRKK